MSVIVADTISCVRWIERNDVVISCFDGIVSVEWHFPRGRGSYFGKGNSLLEAIQGAIAARDAIMSERDREQEQG